MQYGYITVLYSFSLATRIHIFIAVSKKVQKKRTKKRWGKNTKINETGTNTIRNWLDGESFTFHLSFLRTGRSILPGRT